MGWIDKNRGEDGGDERAPGILEQAERILRGESAREPRGILAQADRVMNGLPRTEPTGVLAQASPARPEPPASRRPEASLKERLGRKKWNLNGWIATAGKGASLSELAEVVTGRGRDWELLGYPRDPKKLREGERVDITPLLDKLAAQPVQPAQDAEVPVKPPVKEAPKETPVLPKSDEPVVPEAIIARARAAHWDLKGTTATAQAGATLSALAKAVTGNAQDWTLLGFTREPNTLKAGEQTDITPLLDRLATIPFGTAQDNEPPKGAEEITQAKLEAMAEAAATKYGIPPGILKGLIRQESGWKVAAKSSVGAVGLTQLMPATASKDLGLRVDSQVDERLDPAKNVDAGARYLRRQYDRFAEGKTDTERWRLALAAYNSGPGSVNRRLRAIGKVGKQGAAEWREIAAEAPEQTRDYVQKILGELGEAGGYARGYGYDD